MTGKVKLISAGGGSVSLATPSTGSNRTVTLPDADVTIPNAIPSGLPGADAGYSKNVLTTQGDTLYASGANTLARLAKGTAGQVLKMNSGATAPEWGTDVGGKLIATYNVSNTTSTTVSDSGTWTDTGATITLTPQSVTSKFAIAVSQAIYIQDSSSTEARGGWRLVRAISGGATTELTGNNSQGIYTQSASTGHIEVHGRYAMTFLDDPDTTSEITYHTEINASQDNINTGNWGGNSMYILEIDS